MGVGKAHRVDLSVLSQAASQALTAATPPSLLFFSVQSQAMREVLLSYWAYLKYGSGDLTPSKLSTKKAYMYVKSA